MASILKEWLRRTQARRRVAAPSIYQKWPALVGPSLASATRVAAVNAGELVIEVDSAALLQELSTYGSADLLRTVSADPEFRWVRGLRFRAGAG